MDTPDSERSRCILVASDFSRSADEALRQADAWARRQQAKLSALHVVREALPVHPLFPQRQQRDVTDLVALQRRLAQELSDRIQRLTERSPDDVDVDVDFGDSYAAIVRRAEEIDATLVVVGSVGATDLKRVHLGSVAEKVVHYAHCSVLVVRPPSGGAVVLAATDLSDPALPALRAAARESQARGSRLVVVHDVDRWSVMGAEFGLLGPIPPGPSEQTVERVRLAASQILEGQLERFGVSGDIRIAGQGNPAATIVQAADELNADLVVVATRGRTGLARLALGSIAEVVVRRAHCSVLAVRAE
ncbi:MAG: universal stress protein [Polyangiaceae bacterium]|nr:universal stress protein [Polyangiaceae bacterium]